MKICLLKFKSASSRLINKVIEKSLIDLGHELVKHSKAEIVIVIRNFPEGERKYEDKKYILFQIEQYVGKPELIDVFYDLEADEIWGFDIDNKKEKYTPLGYHPCMLFESKLQEDIDVGFMGWQRGRRDNWLNKVENKWIVLNTFDDRIRGENISRTRINLNIHFHEGSMFTEWGRIAYFLANEQFFISELFHCPIEVPQFEDIFEYNHLTDFYLKYSDERKKMAAEMSQKYKQELDMRDILRRQL